MLNLRKYSYVILWAALICTVALVWLIGKQKAPLVDDTPAVSAAVTEKPSAVEPSGTESAATAEPAEMESSAPEPSGTNILQKELAGVWVPYMSLVTEEKTQAAFAENFQKIADTAKEKGMNSLFVHVRPFSDAFYPSGYFPWSHILTGEQGKNPGFDPLAFMVEYTHKLGMEFHAWINPLRVKTNETPTALSADNPYSELKADYPFYFMEHEGGVYLNPAYPYIRSLIADGAAEIVRNYAVDGIHFDDYFYPAQEDSLDETAYEGYVDSVEVPVSRADFRIANINAMVAEVYEKVKRENPKVVFGISPGGNIENNGKIGADVKTWCAVSGYVDYICPQLYYSYENPALGYTQALQAWLALPKHADLDIYIGLGLYKAGTDADEGTWLGAEDILKRQIQEAQAAECGGVIFYAYDYLVKPETEKEVENAMAVISRAENTTTE